MKHSSFYEPKGDFAHQVVPQHKLITHFVLYIRVLAWRGSTKGRTLVWHAPGFDSQHVVP